MLGRVAALATRALASAASSSSSSSAPQLLQAAEAVCAGSWRSLLQQAPRGFATNSHDIFNTHRDTPDNNAGTTFEWTPVGA